MCIRNMVINFSEKLEDTNGLSANVITADKDACFRTTLTLPSPRNNKPCTRTHS